MLTTPYSFPFSAWIWFDNGNPALPVPLSPDLTFFFLFIFICLSLFSKILPDEFRQTQVDYNLECYIFEQLMLVAVLKNMDPGCCLCLACSAADVAA